MVKKSSYVIDFVVCKCSGCSEVLLETQYWKECSVNSKDFLNPLTPNDHYSGRTAPLTSKGCIIYIYSTNIGTEYFKHGIYSSFFSSKCSLFHNSNVFVSCIFHIICTGCAKIKKNNSGAKSLNSSDIVFTLQAIAVAKLVSQLSVFHGTQVVYLISTPHLDPSWISWIQFTFLQTVSLISTLTLWRLTTTIVVVPHR